MRFLGKTGVKVSRVALGAMSFGGEADERQEDGGGERRQ